MSRLFFKSLLCFLTLSTYTCFGQVSSPSQAPSPIVQTFEDWTVTCSKNPQGTSDIQACQMQQSHRFEGNSKQQNVMSLNIFQRNKGKKVLSYGIFGLPLDVYLAPGILLKVDQKRPFKILYEQCKSSSCYAGFTVSPSVLRTFKKGIAARTRIFTTSKKAIDFSISLKGFSKAFAFMSDQNNSN